MPAMDNGFMLQVVTALVLAGAVYGGIRSDLRGMREHIQRVEKDADKAHERLDRIGYGRRHED